MPSFARNPKNSLPPGGPGRPAALAGLLLLGCGSDPGVGADDPGSGLAPAPGHPTYEALVSLDPEAGTLSASWRIIFLAEEDATAPVSVLLNGELEIERLEGDGIRDHRIEASSFFPTWKRIVLELEKRTPGTPIVLELEYSGRPALPPSGINRISPEWVELSVDSGWLPLFETFDQEWTGVLRVALPEEWGVVAGGPTVYQDDHHVIRNQVPQLDVAFTAAPGLERVASERFTIYHQGIEEREVRQVIEAAESCAAYLNESFGRKDPLPAAALVLADRPSNAYARINYLVLARVGSSGPVAIHRFLCHELAHYWSRGADFTSVHHWMTEGFAEYVAARAVRARFGEETFRDLLARWDEQGRDQGPVWTEASTERGSELAIYRKAPVLLARLEERIGSERFERFLDRYMTGSVNTTPELLAELEGVAGPAAVTAFKTMLAEGP